MEYFEGGVVVAMYFIGAGLLVWAALRVPAFRRWFARWMKDWFNE